MVAPPLATPAFGQADLSNCEREQIHLAGSIQPHGAVLVLRDSDHLIVQASANATAFLTLRRDLVGTGIDAIPGNLSAAIRPHLDKPLSTIPLAIRCRIGDPSNDYDCLLHRPPEGGLVVELERAGPPEDFSSYIGKSLRTILTASSVRGVAEETASIFKDLTGYDRVMVYRFDDEGHGEVLSERRQAALEPYLGNRYPASDIPQIARRLYERNRIRVLADVEDTPVPFVPRLSPLTGRDLDMSLCFLRSMSPIHIQYLKNMGVRATLVVSLVVGGKLWGLLACHHYEPRFVHFEVRAVCQVLAEAISTRIAAMESFAQAQAEMAVRRLEQRLIEAISRDGDWRMALFDSSRSLLQPFGASGASLLFEGQVLTVGDVPGTQDLRDLGAWLDRRSRFAVFATTQLGIDNPLFTPLIPVASGLMAVRISSTPGEYLMWFRPERIRTVTWAGDPLKPVIIGDNPSDLSPRRSFAQWHQLVEATSEAWSPADLTAARLVGDSVGDVILQFRSVRTLIAQDQLDQVRGQVKVSDSPVVIADADGKLLLTNEAFDGMLRASQPHLERIDDLPSIFFEPSDVRRKLQDLVKHQRPWRGEVRLRTQSKDGRPLLVRGDPVLAPPQRLLGYVLLFTDVSERKAADAARRRFQQGIIQRHAGMTVRLDSEEDLAFQNLLASVVENAQLAALEITEGVDTARIPELLDSVRASVTRAAEILEHLVWHAGQASTGEG